MNTVVIRGCRYGRMVSDKINFVQQFDSRHALLLLSPGLT